MIETRVYAFLDSSAIALSADMNTKIKDMETGGWILDHSYVLPGENGRILGFLRFSQGSYIEDSLSPTAKVMAGISVKPQPQVARSGW
jgi:hypothetical protein